MIIKEVIVVEGEHDKARLHHINPNLHIVTTNGAEISEDTLALLSFLQKTRGLILMLDPDYPGEKIRKTINQVVGPTKHIFLPKNWCIDEKKGKVGIEHAPLKIINEALLNHVVTLNHHSENFEMKDLLLCGLTGTKDALKNRHKVCQAFHLGQCNAKTMRKRLNMLGITKHQVMEVLK